MPFDLTPSAMHRGGDAVARDDGGRVVFVRGGLPGERVAVEVVDEAPTYAVARIVEVLDRSAARIDPPCAEVAHGCGGCSWQHVAPAEQRRIKERLIADALTRSVGPAPVAVSPTVALADAAFRTTLRMTVRDGRAAFREARSHDAVVVDGCHVAHPLLEELVVEGRFGDASEVVLRCGARTAERLAAPTPRGTEIAVPDDVADRHFHEEAAGRRWRVSAASFFQSRPDGVDALADLVRAATGDLAPGHALDLFSGVGLFAGVLADQGWRVTAVEGARPSVADARVNLRGLDVAVVAADVNRWKAPVAEFVVADPSRAGLGPRGARTVVASGARRVVLISCDLGALGRDAARLRDAGFALSSVTPVDFFPHTPHVEVVAVFDG